MPIADCDKIADVYYIQEYKIATPNIEYATVMNFLRNGSSKGYGFFSNRKFWCSANINSFSLWTNSSTQWTQTKRTESLLRVSVAGLFSKWKQGIDWMNFYFKEAIVRSFKILFSSFLIIGHSRTESKAFIKHKVKNLVLVFGDFLFFFLAGSWRTWLQTSSICSKRFEVFQCNASPKFQK